MDEIKFVDALTLVEFLNNPSLLYSEIKIAFLGLILLHSIM